MKTGPARLARLKRLERIRDVARIEALERAAQSERQLARHTELARRSGELANAFAGRWEATTGQGLRDLRNFHSALANLSEATSRDTVQARETADIHRLDAASAARRRDLVADQRKTVERAQSKTVNLSRSGEQAILARVLNRKG